MVKIKLLMPIYPNCVFLSFNIDGLMINKLPKVSIIIMNMFYLWILTVFH